MFLHREAQMAAIERDLNPSPRLLLGPGPSMVPPRVLRAMATPLLGHLDPEFIAILMDLQDLLRRVFQTGNRLTLAVPGSGTAAMEAALVNLIEPGDRVLACVHGFFGDRLAEISRRLGAEVARLEVPWGQAFDMDAISQSLQERPARIVTLVHAETSTGVRQPEIEAVAAACHRHGALLVLDCVTSLGGLPVEVDAWDIDVAYGAAQKCLSAPPGLSPITVSPRAEEKIRSRRSPVPSLYLDLTMLDKYWNDPPVYHHTASMSLAYALREALRLVMEEGLQERFERHERNAERLWKGLETLSLPPMIPLPFRLPTLTTISLPAALDDAGLRRRLLREFNIEIGPGFGQLAGKVWRIGLMGYAAQAENAKRLVAALREILPRG
jgi:alanine-glyoxylate transaminase/serine-glyoxylate transaminase/serine-pyruvate transaminase